MDFISPRCTTVPIVGGGAQSRLQNRRDCDYGDSHQANPRKATWLVCAQSRCVWTRFRRWWSLTDNFLVGILLTPRLARGSCRCVKKGRRREFTLVANLKGERIAVGFLSQPICKYIGVMETTWAFGRFSHRTAAGYVRTSEAKTAPSPVSSAPWRVYLLQSVAATCYHHLVENEDKATRDDCLDGWMRMFHSCRAGPCRGVWTRR